MPCVLPSHSRHYLPRWPLIDLKLDTQKSVVDILNTDLFSPKSPSVQMKDNEWLGVHVVSDADRGREELLSVVFEDEWRRCTYSSALHSVLEFLVR